MLNDLNESKEVDAFNEDCLIVEGDENQPPPDSLKILKEYFGHSKFRQ